MRIQSTAILGTVRLLPGEPPLACRDTAEARWWARAVARRLAAREARALHALAGIGGFPALLDFRLAWRDPRRGRLFRLMAREDLRHLLKHKRQYCAQHLSARQRRLLASPSGAARLWRWTLQPLGRRLRAWLG